MDVCVIGAGVIGLSTAVALQERVPSPTACRVTIVADRFGRHTTSYGSGGQIVPFSPPGIPVQIGRKWSQDTVDHFYDLAFSPEASVSGVNLVSGFQLTDNDEMPPYMNHALNVRKLDAEGLQRLGRTYKNGYIATTSLVELPLYLEWLRNKFLSNGGKVVKKYVKSFEDLGEDFDVVVNCTGLGSKELVNDPLMRPVRGQVLHLKAPWIKNFVRVDGSMLIYPFRDSVFVGTVLQNNNDNLNLSVEDSDFILKRAQEVFPALKGATVQYEWVGLRPQRDTVRLEEETIATKQGRPLKVVHNYGHGSIGISLSWGTAIHAANMVQSILREKTHTSKL